MGSASVIFGVYGFYVLSMLFENNDHFTSTLGEQEYIRVRTGYAFSWATFIVAYLSGIPVYASPDSVRSSSSSSSSSFLKKSKKKFADPHCFFFPLCIVVW